MKNLFFALLLCSGLFANDKKAPSTIKEVTVYLSGAQITRTAHCILKEGTNELVFTGLSHRIDESSIQVSGLKAVSILSIEYDTNFLEKSISNPEVQQWEDEISSIDHKIALLKNIITGLQEEEKVITTNRLVSTDNQALSLEKVKQISQYYRERITAIKDEVFKTNLKIDELRLEANAINKQLAETNNAPEEKQGEITIKFDAPVTTTLELTLSYIVEGAGWVPNYDIKSTALNSPLSLAYKANVYQKTGQDWKDVQILLSTETPQTNISKPKLDAHFLNFTSRYSNRYQSVASKKQGYAYNPNVKKVVGMVTDESGLPLPGVNIIVKGTTNGTQTDFDGNYSIDVPYGQELQFSYLGMHSQEVPLYSSIINMNMEEDVAQLEEVVVSGYGSAKKNYTNAISSVSSEDISSVLQGRAAGINVNSNTGNIRIRGISSFSPNKEPLYVVDGKITSRTDFGLLNPDDIESVEVLKNGAVNLYGSRAANGVVIIKTKNGNAFEEKSELKKNSAKTQFIIKKPYTIASDGDITAIEINTYTLPATYEYFAAPIVNENVFLTASFKDWEQYQLLPGEANIYFEGTYAGKTVLDPYTTKKEMILSLGIEPNITVSREQDRNFKSKSFTGSNRILDRTYNLDVKNNKNTAIDLKLMDRIPKSQNKEIKVEDIITNSAEFDKQKGLLTWKMMLNPQESKKESFSFQIKYPRGRYISL